MINGYIVVLYFKQCSAMYVQPVKRLYSCSLFQTMQRHVCATSESLSVVKQTV